MNENWLEICEHTGEGFRPLIMFNDWRVAVLNYLDEIHPNNNKRMERHVETDEVFVLTKGRAVLIIGGIDAQVTELHPQIMDVGKLYNVRRNAWHTVLLSQDASILLVENRDTGESNSEYFQLSAEQHGWLEEVARQGAFD
jgi:ureidoglycolate hydrolase